MATATGRDKKRAPRIATIGVDIGGTKTLFSLFDADFKVVQEMKVRTLESESPAEFAAVFSKTLARLVAAARRKKLELMGVGIGCAGTLEPNGRVKESPNIQFLNGFDFCSVVEKTAETNLVLENDVVAGLYGEHQLGSAAGQDHVLGIFIGTGVGGALIVNGKIYRGANGVAGDIGHYLLQPLTRLTGSESQSILDDVLSRPAIAGAAAVLASKKQAPFIEKCAGSDIQKITSGALKKAIAHGDKKIEELVRTRCRTLGIVLANIVDFLNPGMIVLGGGLTSAIPKIVRDEVRAGIRENATAKAQRKLEVVVAKLKDHAVTTGAAVLAREHAKYLQSHAA